MISLNQAAHVSRSFYSFLTSQPSNLVYQDKIKLMDRETNFVRSVEEKDSLPKFNTTIMQTMLVLTLNALWHRKCIFHCFVEQRIHLGIWSTNVSRRNTVESMSGPTFHEISAGLSAISTIKHTEMKLLSVTNNLIIPISTIWKALLHYVKDSMKM